MSNGKWSIRKDSISKLWIASYFVAVTSFAADNKTLTVTFYSDYWGFIEVLSDVFTPEYFREVREGGAAIWLYNPYNHKDCLVRIRVVGIDYY